MDPEKDLQYDGALSRRVKTNLSPKIVYMGNILQNVKQVGGVNIFL